MQENQVHEGGKTKVSGEVRKFLTNFYTHLRPNHRTFFSTAFSRASKVTYDFVNFNYTKTLRWSAPSRGATTYKENFGSILHVHGEVNNAPLLGVDNENQIANPEFRKLMNIRRSLLKPQLSQEMQTGKMERAMSLIKKANIIVCFGLSLGESDHSWWKQIGTWLTQTQNSVFVIFWYPEEHISPLFPEDELSIEDDVLNDFARLAKISSDEYEAIKSEKLFARVHDGIFKEKAINEDEIPAV